MTLYFEAKKQEVGHIFSFYFKPAEPLDWIAGQSIKLELPVEFGSQERRFTVSSAPYEMVIRITTKASNSEFKQALMTLNQGDRVQAHSIDGEFIWQETSTPKVLAASGVGITPFRAMLKQRDFENKPLEAMLLYANHSDEFLFASTLKELSAKHPAFSVVWLPSQRLNAQIISQYIQDKVYVSGPSAMVDDISQELLKMGITQQQLKRDWFTGRRGWDSV